MTDRQATFLKVIFLLFAFCWFFGRLAYGQEGPTPIAPTAEVQVLKTKNLQLRESVLRLQWTDLQKQVQVAMQQLEDEKQALERELRAALTPPSDWTFDWSRGAFVPPAPKPEPPK